MHSKQLRVLSLFSTVALAAFVAAAPELPNPYVDLELGPGCPNVCHMKPVGGTVQSLPTGAARPVPDPKDPCKCPPGSKSFGFVLL